MRRMSASCPGRVRGSAISIRLGSVRTWAADGSAGPFDRHRRAYLGGETSDQWPTCAECSGAILLGGIRLRVLVEEFGERSCLPPGEHGVRDNIQLASWTPGTKLYSPGGPARDWPSARSPTIGKRRGSRLSEDASLRGCRVSFWRLTASLRVCCADGHCRRRGTLWTSSA